MHADNVGRLMALERLAKPPPPGASQA
jgi:hypothetical protein